MRLAESREVHEHAPEPPDELRVWLFEIVFHCFAPRRSVSPVPLVVAFALPPRFEPGVLLPPLAFVPTLPSAAACPLLDLVAHYHFHPLYSSLPQPRQLFFFLVS